jgi:uncharacterized membrane protein YidH (DUF202 family)
VKLIGVLLIVLGVVALAIGGFSYTTRDTVLDIGPIHATAERQHNLPIAPIGGIAMLVCGVVLVVASTKNKV